MAIVDAYNRGESDEFIQPKILTKDGRIMPRIQNGESIIFFNRRSGRARQIAKAFVPLRYSACLSYPPGNRSKQSCAQ